MSRVPPAALAFAAVTIAVVAVLAVRVLDLEQRLSAAERRLGAQNASAGSGTAQAAAPSQSHDQRLAAIEGSLRALRDDLTTLEQATETTLAVPMAQPGADPKQILSVVGREQERIRDRQLEFQRSGWQRGRKAALEQFATQHHLVGDQKEQLDELLTTETDKLVSILRRPDVLENPEQAAADWMTVLRDTDRAAHGVLDPQQLAPWDLARAIERRILWPWLHEE